MSSSCFRPSPLKRGNSSIRTSLRSLPLSERLLRKPLSRGEPNIYEGGLLLFVGHAGHECERHPLALSSSAWSSLCRLQ